jgi:hypothetical protein
MIKQKREEKKKEKEKLIFNLKSPTTLFLPETEFTIHLDFLIFMVPNLDTCLFNIMSKISVTLKTLCVLHSFPELLSTC